MIVPPRGKRMERSHKINCPNLGFHMILIMKEISLVGRTCSCIMDKAEITMRNKLPQFRVLQSRRMAENGLDFIGHTKCW